MSERKDYYEILEVTKTASDDEIKRSYRKLALRWHPDKNKENKEEAQKRFQEISEAYSTLSDKKKRRLYDRGGEEHFRFSFKDAMKIFEDFFGSFDLFGDDFFPSGLFSKTFKDDFFGDKFFKEFKNKGTTMYSTSIESSTVIKDGVKKTKTKRTEIEPDGIEKVKITEEVTDKDGKVTTKERYLEDGKEKNVKAITMGGKRKKPEGSKDSKRREVKSKKSKKLKRKKNK